MSAVDALEVGPRLAVDAEVGPTPPWLGSADIALVVESVLRSAMDRLEAEAAAARAESTAAVAAAVRRSAELVRSPGAQPTAGAPDSGSASLGSSRLPSPDDQELGPEVTSHTPGQVYDLFWSEIPADQPIRERLRRWAQRPQP